MLTPCCLCSELLTKGSRLPGPVRCCEGVLFGNFLAIAMKMSLTFIAVLAEVSINNKLFSSAYTWASYSKTHREGSLTQYSQSQSFLNNTVTVHCWCYYIYAYVSIILWHIYACASNKERAKPETKHAKTFPEAGRKKSHVSANHKVNYPLSTTLIYSIFIPTFTDHGQASCVQHSVGTYLPRSPPFSCWLDRPCCQIMQ